MSKVSGPLFDGRADRAVDDYTDEVETAIGEKAKALLQINLKATLRNPTGFYQSRIRLQRHGEGVQLNDSDVIYGYWLEGVSSKNSSSSFKGYRNFKKTGQQITRQAQSIALQKLPKYLRRMQ